MQTDLRSSLAVSAGCETRFRLLSDPRSDAIANDFKHRAAISCLTFGRVKMGGTRHLRPFHLSPGRPKPSLDFWYERADVVEIAFAREHQ
jgi:hypothetical protein